MTASKWPKWDRYERDARFTTETDIIETPWPKLAQIWLGHPNFFCFRFSILHTWDCDTLKNNDQKIWGVSVISASLGQGVSVILVSTVRLAANSGSSVSIISVSVVNLASHLGYFNVVILGTPYSISFCRWFHTRISSSYTFNLNIHHSATVVVEQKLYFTVE